MLNITRSLYKDSEEHLKCELDKNKKSIADVLRKNTRLLKISINNNVHLNRLFLQTVIDTVLHLSKQDFALCRYSESANFINQGNFKELLLDVGYCC